MPQRLVPEGDGPQWATWVVPDWVVGEAVLGVYVHDSFRPGTSFAATIAEVHRGKELVRYTVDWEDGDPDNRELSADQVLPRPAPLPIARQKPVQKPAAAAAAAVQKDPRPSPAARAAVRATPARKGGGWSSRSNGTADNRHNKGSTAGAPEPEPGTADSETGTGKRKRTGRRRPKAHGSSQVRPK